MKNIINEEYVPKRATKFSAGYDLYATEDITLSPGHFKTLDTGVVFEDKDHLFGVSGLAVEQDGQSKIVAEVHQAFEYVGLVFPRSSYGFKYGLRFANSICVIDQDYRDTIKLRVTVSKKVEIKKGDRIAQLIFVPWLLIADEIPPTDIRDGGIGSTGN